MLIDTAKVVFKGGHGGPGIISFGSMAQSGPDGGNGGRGGDLYVRASSDITLLNQFSKKTEFSAGNGEAGGKNKKSGLAGRDLEILLPIGTSVIEEETGKVLVELTKVGQRQLICSGGKGGRGNFEFRSSTRTTPMIAQPGLEGEEKRFTLSLRLIADFGLIGLPNAGKSSLLNELTNAQPKIANYPFTTLFPNLGVYEGKFLADIPGLIEGAASGKGLGIRFLKHIEKVEVILHCISVESEDVTRDYETIRTELGNYNAQLLNKTEVILVTKTDLVEPKTVKQLVKALKGKTKTILPVSIHDWESLETLKRAILE